MGWETDIEELRRREALARQMGGPDKVKRQHDAGRLTVRERIAALLDPESFHEIGALAGRAQYGANNEIESFQPANFVFGRGHIDGHPVVVGGDDFTVRGGAADAAIRQKQVMSEQMANELRIPLVRLVDGTGGGGSVKTIETQGYTYVPANPAKMVDPRPNRPQVLQTADCYVDRNGLMYLTDQNAGLNILQYEGL